jgi:hypothetical protein
VEHDNVITLRDESWSDYSVRVEYRNSRGGMIGTHVDGGNGVFYHFELIRDFPNFFDVVNQGSRSDFTYGSFIHTDSLESSRAIFSMLLEPYPYILLAMLVGLVLALALASIERRTLSRVRFDALWQRRWRRAAIAGALLLAAGCFSVTFSLACM